MSPTRFVCYAMTITALGACNKRTEVPPDTPATTPPPVQAATLSALQTEAKTVVAQAAKLAVSGGATPEYMALMKRGAAIAARIDALAAPQCAQLIRLAAELRAVAGDPGRAGRSPADEAQAAVLDRWKGKPLVAIGNVTAFGKDATARDGSEQALLSGTTRFVVQLRTVGSIAGIVGLRLALPSGAHADRLRKGGLFKVTGAVLPKKPGGANLIPYPVYLSVSRIEAVP